MIKALAPTEAEAREALSALRIELDIRTPAENEAWDWAEDVALWFLLDECIDEFGKSGFTVREWFARDISTRLSVQLQEMTKDIHPDEEREGKKLARAGLKIAEKLSAIVAATARLRTSPGPSR